MSHTPEIIAIDLCRQEEIPEGGLEMFTSFSSGFLYAPPERFTLEGKTPEEVIEACKAYALTLLEKHYDEDDLLEDFDLVLWFDESDTEPHEEYERLTSKINIIPVFVSGDVENLELYL